MNSFWISLCSALGIAISLGAQMLNARYFGAGAQFDAYLISVAVPTYVAVVVVAVVNSSFLPHYLRIRAGYSRHEAVEFYRGTLRAVVLVCSTLVIVGILLSKVTVDLVAPSLSPASRSLAVHLSYYSWPQILLWGVFAVVAAELQANSRYILAAAAPAAGGVVALLGVRLLAKRAGVEAVAISVLAGLVMQVATLYAYRPTAVVGRASLRWREAKEWRKSAIGLAATGLIVRLSPVLERAAAAALTAGVVSHLSYANRMLTSLSGVVSSGIGIVGYTTLAQQVALDDYADAAEAVRRMIRAVLTVCAPLLVLMAIDSESIASILFRRGNMSSDDVRVVSSLLRVYLPFFLAASLGTVIGRALYALRLTKISNVIDVVCLVGYAALLFGFASDHGARAIVACCSVYFVVSVTSKLFIVRRRLALKVTPHDLGYGVRLLASLAAMCAVLLSVPSASGRLAIESVRCVLAAAVFVVAGWLTGIREVRDTLTKVGARLR